MNFTDPTGFDCYDSLSSCGQAQAAMAAQAQAQTQSQAMAMAQAQAAGLAQMYGALSNAASNSAGADVHAQNVAQGAQQGLEMASQASARALEQVQAQNRTNQDAQRAHDATFMNPYTTPLPTPETGNGLYYGPPMGISWAGYLAEGGSGGAGNQRSDAGSNGTSANGNPLPYVEQDPTWLKIAAGMCLTAEINAAIKVWTLADKLESEVPLASDPVGRRGAPIEIEPGSNTPATIGGREFTGHALDRMQGRGLTPTVVENTIQQGKAFPGSVPGTTRFVDPVNRTTAVVDTATGRVVTAY